MVSKRNEELIRLRKQEELENKRSQQARVREMETKSRENVENFHREK